MTGDRTRASDAERESAVAVLRSAAAEGRLGMDELDRRSAAAYAAATRGTLAELLRPAGRGDPLVVKPPRPARRRPRWPGRMAFDARWRYPGDPVAATADVVELVALLVEGQERITIDLVERGDETAMVAQGVAPLRVRQAFAELE